ncbi:MAG: amino acid adenylation domain-containing protein [Chitinophagaceae bacterium]|nr:amino acid adenylation domain-containing protein [Oligoflexus sp.]
MSDHNQLGPVQLDQLFQKQMDILLKQLELLKGLHNPDYMPEPTRTELPLAVPLATQLATTPAPISAPCLEKQNNRIAVIGMAGRYPDAKNLQEFWRNLNEGRESITHFRPEEIDHAVPAEERNHPNYGRSRGVLEDADKFDAEFFRISPREAKVIDPQQRIFLEIAYEALQDAGYDPDQFPGEVGVFGGVGDNYYHIHNVLDKKELIKKVGSLSTAVGNMKDYVATRVSYKLNLTGPSVSLNTACSTSLVAVDQAVWGLRNGTCDIALAGAASIYVPQKAGFMHGPGLPFSSDGHIRPFSSDATGVMFSDGAGIVVLKRLDDAVRDGDHIYGVIIGTALNNDGIDKMSFFAPSSSGQTRVIKKALKDADVSADTLSFVEAHATGTMLGDPVEFEGLKGAFADDTQRKNFCAIGAYKANIGHTDAAAGVTGLIKALLAIKHRKLPPNINYKSPNPSINFEDSPFYIPQQAVVLDSSMGPIRAGVSAFGFGGTNSHVIVEEAPSMATGVTLRPRQLILLSAETPAALERSTKDFIDYFKAKPEAYLADTAYTLTKGRKAFPFRRFISAATASEAVELLLSLDTHHQAESGEDVRDVAFMFPGQGIQSVNMGRDLYASEVLFRTPFDQCAELLEPMLGLDIRHLVFPTSGAAPSDLLDQTRYAQAAIFSMEYSLAQVFIGLGVKPSAMIGHSLGELVCATIAGVFSLSDALFLITHRGRLMQSMSPGQMMIVNLSEADLASYLSARLQIAAVNGPKQCVVAGSSEAIAAFQSEMEKASVSCRMLKTSHAFHSHTVEPIMKEFEELFQKVSVHAPQIAYISTLTGDWIQPEQAMSPSYWAEHMRSPVRFFAGIQRLWAAQNYLLLELGPRDTVCVLARKAALDITYKAVPTLAGVDSYACFQNALGQLWSLGLKINWDLYFHNENRQRQPLPTYSFEKVSHWLDSRPADAVSSKMIEDRQILSTSIEINAPVAQAVVLPIPAATPDVVNVDEALKRRVKDLFEDISGISITAHAERTSFLELGFDSLTLTQIIVMLKRNFGLDTSYTRIVKEWNTLQKLLAVLQSSQSTSRGSDPKQMPTLKALSLNTSEASYSQVRMWMHDHIKPGATTYNIPIYFEITGALQAKVFEEALAQILKRHDVLRSTFHLEGHRVLQRVSAEHEPAFTFVDLSDRNVAQSETELAALLQTHGRKHLPVDKGPIVRFTLIKMDAARHYFLLNAHHIAFDLLSIRLFLKELSLSYVSAIEGRGFITERPAFQFSDFSVWQRNWMEQGEKSRQIKYWEDHLGFAPVPVLRLPLDHNRPQAQPEFDQTYTVQFSKAPMESLLNLAKSDGTTPFMVFLATYKCLLMLVSRQRDLVIGTPIASRSLPEIQGMIGFFANTLALRTQATDATPFLEILKHVRDITVGAFEHQDAPLDEVIRLLEIDRSPAIHTLFQSFFSFEKVSHEHYALGDCRMSFKGDVSRAAPATDLNLWIEEHAEHLRLDVEFSTRLFKTESIVLLFANFERLLQAIAKNPSLTLGAMTSILEDRVIAERFIAPKIDIKADTANFLAICRDILDLERIEMDRSFQHHGGHSLLALKFLNRLKEDFGLELELKDFLKAASLRDVWKLCTLKPLELVQSELSILLAERPCTACGIHDLFTQSAAQNPEKIAIRYKNKTISYAELEKRSNQVAHFLRSIGVEVGTIVGIAMDRSLDLIVSMLGILKAGAAYLPMDPAYPNDRLQYMAENSGIKLIVTEEEYAETLDMPNSIRLLAMDEEKSAIEKHPNTAPVPALKADSLAYVIYTSGSTGKPKGVEIPHFSAAEFLISMQEAVHFTSDEVLMALTTISFDISVLEIFMTLAAGATLILMDSEDALDGKKLALTLEQQQVTFFQATPSGWRVLLDGPFRGSQRITGLCGGEAFPKDLAERLLPLLGSVYNVYGPTEATVWTTFNRLEQAEDHKIIGRPLKNYRVHILNADLQDSGVETGDLYIGGTALARGYRNRPDLTAERFIPDPFFRDALMYNTGDRARFTADGRIEYMGRADDQVKIRGFRIELGEIEAVANSFASIKVSAAIVHEPLPGDQRIVLFVQPQGSEEVDMTKLKAFMQSRLPAYFIPNRMEVIESIPLTHNGKLDRKALKDSYAQDRIESPSLQAASTEEWLIDLWKKYLHQQAISKSSNFFEAGGYSLLAIIVASEISARSGRQIGLPDLLASTLEQLALRIDQGTDAVQG